MRVVTLPWLFEHSPAFVPARGSGRWKGDLIIGAGQRQANVGGPARRSASGVAALNYLGLGNRDGPKRYGRPFPRDRGVLLRLVLTVPAGQQRESQWQTARLFLQGRPISAHSLEYLSTVGNEINNPVRGAQLLRFHAPSTVSSASFITFPISSLRRRPPKGTRRIADSADIVMVISAEDGGDG